MYQDKKQQKNVAINVKDKPKSFWKYANSRLKTRPAIPTLIKADGSTPTTPKDKANMLTISLQVSSPKRIKMYSTNFELLSTRRPKCRYYTRESEEEIN